MLVRSKTNKKSRADSIANDPYIFVRNVCAISAPSTIEIFFNLVKFRISFVLRFVGRFYGKCMENVCLKAP